MTFKKGYIFISRNGKKYKIKIIGICIILLIFTIIIGCLILLALTLKKIILTKPTVVKPVISSSVVDKNISDYNIDIQSETLLHETNVADESYIRSTLFLGDSNTARFLKVMDRNGKPFTNKENTIGVVGMGIDAISSLACMDFSTGRKTIVESVKLLQPERIIITFGTNNLSGESTDTSNFIERYEAQLQKIVSAYPSVDLIVNAIPPITKNTIYTNLSMKQIDAYNEALLIMCKKNNWKFLNSAEVLKDSKTGFAKTSYMIDDGLHLSRDGLTALFKYIKNHAYITSDDRIKPLAKIPTIIGVPDGLIRVNPITDIEFEEDPALLQDSEKISEESDTVDPLTTLEPSASPISEDNHLPSPLPSASPSLQPNVAPTEPSIPSETVSPPSTTPDATLTPPPVSPPQSNENDTVPIEADNSKKEGVNLPVESKEENNG